MSLSTEQYMKVCWKSRPLKTVAVIVLLLCCGMDIPNSEVFVKSTKRIYREGFIDGAKWATERIRDVNTNTPGVPELEKAIEVGWTNMMKRF